MQKQCWASSVFLLLWLIIAHFSEGKKKGKYFLLSSFELKSSSWKCVGWECWGDKIQMEKKKGKWQCFIFQKLWWRHFYGDKSCLICWIMRHIFDKLFKRWMNVYFGLNSGCKGICWKSKVLLSLLSINVYFEWLDGNLCTSANGMADTYRNPSILVSC